MSKPQSYLEKYHQRVRSQSPEPRSSGMLDKQNYVQCLEAKLQEASQALLNSQLMEQRIQQLQAQLNTAEDKILNLTRVLKLQQSHVDSSEHDPSLPSTLRAIELRLATLENKFQNYKTPEFLSQVDTALQDTETRIRKLLKQNTQEIDQKLQDSHRELEQSLQKGPFAKDFLEKSSQEKETIAKQAADAAWEAEKTCNKLAEDTINRISVCEKEIKKVQNFDWEEIQNTITSEVTATVDKITEMVKDYADLQNSLSKDVQEITKRVLKLEQNKEPPKVIAKTETKTETRKAKSPQPRSPTPPRKRLNSHDLKKSRSPTPDSSKEETKAKPKKRTKTSKRAKLEKLYQQLSARNN